MNIKKPKNVIYIVTIIILEVALIALAVFKRDDIFAIFQPIIIGLTIAYIINPFMALIERGIAAALNKMFNFNSKVAKALSRVLAIVVSLGLVLFIIVFIFAMLIPEIVGSVTQLSDTLPDVIINEISALAEKFHISDIYDSAIETFSANVVSLASSLSTGAANVVIGTVTVVKDSFIGFIIAAYVLYSKETLLAQSKKLINAILKNESTVNAVFEDIRESNKIFSSFFSGKIVDSLVIGIICFIAMMIFGMPYAALVSVIIGVTNIIPFFGPFIGAVPTAALIMLNDFWSGIYFIILIIVLQIFDGYFLGPRIIGGTTGLSPLWVMIAILVFGGLFGFIGMLFGVPILAVIFMLLKRVVNRRIAEKEQINNV